MPFLGPYDPDLECGSLLILFADNKFLGCLWQHQAKHNRVTTVTKVACTVHGIQQNERPKFVNNTRLQTNFMLAFSICQNFSLIHLAFMVFFNIVVGFSSNCIHQNDRLSDSSK